MEILGIQEAVQYLFSAFQLANSILVSPTSKNLDDYWAVITPATLKLAKKTANYKHEYHIDLKQMTILLNGALVDKSHIKDIYHIFENLVRKVKQKKAIVYQKGAN